MKKMISTLLCVLFATVILAQGDGDGLTADSDKSEFQYNIGNNDFTDSINLLDKDFHKISKTFMDLVFLHKLRTVYRSEDE